jgi:hypothetical protein
VGAPAGAVAASAQPHSIAVSAAAVANAAALRAGPDMGATVPRRTRLAVTSRHAMADEARLLIKDGAGFCGVWREVYLELWAQPASVEQIKRRFEAQRAFINGLNGKKIITVAVVDDAAIKQLEPEQRKLIDDGVKATTEIVKAGAIVIRATGFKAAFMRGILAALFLVTRATYATKVESDVEGGLRFILSHLDAPASIEDTIRAWTTLEKLASQASA